MTAFALIGAAATDPSLQEARAALQSRGQLCSPETAGAHIDIAVAALPHGTRTVPADIAEVARATGARGLLLWTTEPMVRPVTSLGAGNVVLASPAARHHVLSALDLLLGAPTARAGHQVLLRHFWAAWSTGAKDTPLDSLHSDSGGAVLVHCGGGPCGAASQTAARTIAQAQTDARRSSLLREALGEDAHVAHLAPGGGHWLVYWPKAAAPLWLYSPLRMPSRWSVSATLANTGVPLVRMPAYPGDLLVAASLAEPDIATLLAALPQGALEVHRTLESVTRRPSDWGFVVEVR